MTTHHTLSSPSDRRIGITPPPTKRPSPRTKPLAAVQWGLLGWCFCIAPAWAQTPSATEAASDPNDAALLPEVVVTTKAGPVFDVEQAAVGGFDAPLAKTPQSISVLGSDLIAATGMQTLSQAQRLDASLSDNYNTPGYPESLNVRGFGLTAIGNYQRNGLTVDPYAPVAFENKDSLEVLKGVAGLQTGVAAPGGLVNWVTKTPQAHAFDAVALTADQRGGTKLHWDSNRRIGEIGLRWNIAAESLRSHFHDADGQRRFASLALDVPLTAQTQLTADLEYQRKSQPSVPGLGLLDMDGDGIGEALPSRIDPRLNLNNQSWSLPYQTRHSLAQVAMQHRFNDDWSGRAALNVSRTRLNDRIAFPDGCSASDVPVYPGLCADGGVDMYDFRDDGIRHNMTSWQTQLDGKVQTGAIAHTVRLGVSGYRARERHQPFQAYNWVGTSNIYQPITVPSDAQLTTPNTQRNQQSTSAEVSLRSTWSDQWQSFAGLRVSRLTRASALSDGSESVRLQETVATPWLGLSFQPHADWMTYLSWGQGVELEAAPTQVDSTGQFLFSNAGQVLPAMKSTQTEWGVKWQAKPRLLLSAAVFQIDRPSAERVTLADATQPTFQADARKARHRGVELNASGRIGTQLSLQASATWLDAKYTRSSNASIVGQRVTNVPRLATSVFADYKLPQVQGLSLHGLLWQQQGKRATDDGRTTLPRAWQFDAGLRYEHALGDRLVQWSLLVENLTDRRYWREAAPTSWGGVYLFPSAPRTVRAGVRLEW